MDNATVKLRNTHIIKFFVYVKIVFRLLYYIISDVYSRGTYFKEPINFLLPFHSLQYYNRFLIIYTFSTAPYM